MQARIPVQDPRPAGLPETAGASQRNSKMQVESLQGRGPGRPVQAACPVLAGRSEGCLSLMPRMVTKIMTITNSDKHILRTKLGDLPGAV